MRILLPIMTTPTRTVWVLGSGFSRSLGGPLLSELISEKTKEETLEVFPVFGPRETVYYVFNSHSALWSHAEEFLEYIDTALRPDSPRRAILARYLGTAANFTASNRTPLSVEEFRDQAVLTIAAECSTYTKDVDTRAEAWGPYKRWASQRGPSDTIITFNYDLVLESLMTQGGPFTSDSFVLPGRAPLVNSPSATVLKLHGSVNWGLERVPPVSLVPRIVPNVEDFAGKSEYRPLIATPGATKSDYCNKHLRTLWDAAYDALKTANAIIFLGYRFPPSDSEAREKILQGIADNQQQSLRIHTVLGPKVQDDVTIRLTGLLEHTVRGAGRNTSHGLMYRILNQPLYVEDFLSVASQKTLEGY